MLQAKFHGNQVFGSREEDFWRVFIHGRSGLPFDPDFMIKRSFSLSMEAQHKIWLF